MLKKALKKTIVGIATSLLLASTQAVAVVVNEMGDAGSTLGTAMILAPGTTSVNGTIESGLDTDLYRFTLLMDTTLTIEGIFPDEDANLILFNSLGQGLAGDDDDDNDCITSSTLAGLDSCLTLMLTSGDYYIGFGDNNIGAFESFSDWQNDLGNDFIDNDFGILGNPTTETLGYLGTEGGPDDLNDTGDYTINFIDLPEAGSLAFFSLGLVGLINFRKKTVAD